MAAGRQVGRQCCARTADEGAAFQNQFGWPGQNEGMTGDSHQAGTGGDAGFREWRHPLPWRRGWQRAFGLECGATCRVHPGIGPSRPRHRPARLDSGSVSKSFAWIAIRHGVPALANAFR